jgi:hypothetical protein
LSLELITPNIYKSIERDAWLLNLPFELDVKILKDLEDFELFVTVIVEKDVYQLTS